MNMLFQLTEIIEMYETEEIGLGSVILEMVSDAEYFNNGDGGTDVLHEFEASLSCSGGQQFVC